MSLRPATPWSLGASAKARTTAELDARRSPARPRLELVEGGRNGARRAGTARVIRPHALPSRLRLVVVVGAVVAALFGVVAFHVVLSQGQFRLADLSTRASAEQQRYERLRLEVARLEAPSRITNEATGRLGMVAPGDVIAVSPGPADAPAAPLPQHSVDRSDASPTTTIEDGDAGAWSRVKPHLTAAAQ